MKPTVLMGDPTHFSVVGGAKGVNWVADVRSLRERIHERGYDVVHAQYGGKTALAAVAGGISNMRGPKQ